MIALQMLFEGLDQCGNRLLSLGEVAQAVAAFVVVQAALNWLVDNYPGLAECLSSVNRVGSLLSALDDIERDEPLQATDLPGQAPPAAAANQQAA